MQAWAKPNRIVVVCPPSLFAAKKAQATQLHQIISFFTLSWNIHRQKEGRRKGRRKKRRKKETDYRIRQDSLQLNKQWLCYDNTCKVSASLISCNKVMTWWPAASFFLLILVLHSQPIVQPIYANSLLHVHCRLSERFWWWRELKVIAKQTSLLFACEHLAQLPELRATYLLSAYYSVGSACSWWQEGKEDVRTVLTTSI